MQGKMINYNTQKGYGFIYSDDYPEHIFVHISEVKNSDELMAGQMVEFKIKKTPKGASAISVIAGATEKSPYFIFGSISAIITASLFVLFYYRSIHPLFAYLISINIATFLLYGYDKLISSTDRLRIPEWNLQSLALLGGSPMALFSQKFFRHKTIKGSFQLIYWLIVLAQIVGISLFVKFF